MGLIEIIILLIVAGVIGSVIFSSPSNRGRVDWSKVGWVFLGLPLLLLVAVGGMFFAYQSRSVIFERSMEQEKMAAQLAELREIQARAEQGNSSSVTKADVPATPEFHTESYVAAHAQPSPTVQVIEQTTRVDSWSAIAIVIVFLAAMALLLTIFKKNRAVMVLVSAACVGAGLSLMWSIDRSVQTTGMPGPHARPSVETSAPLATTDVGEEEEGIPVTESSEVKSVQPERILQVSYDLTNGRRVEKRGVHELPLWVTEVDKNPQMTVENDELKVVSGRYASVHEAEQEIRNIVNRIVRHHLATEYPEMRGIDVSSQELLRYGALEEGYEVTWPFRVGEFKDQVFQIAWKIKLTDPIEKRIYAIWQADEVNRRLAVLAGGVGLLTVLFGLVAIILRNRNHENSIA